MLERAGTSNGGTIDRVSQLVRALNAERSLLGELREVLMVQREAVAQNDQAGVEVSIHAMGRIMLTLEESRRQRRAVLSLIADGNEVALTDLEEYVGDPVPEDLRSAREAVQRLAVATANDLAINQHVLDRVLHAGDTFLQRLFSTGLDTCPSYGPAKDGDERAEAMLVNRTA
jgi:hypothetical protein